MKTIIAVLQQNQYIGAGQYGLVLKAEIEEFAAKLGVEVVFAYSYNDALDMLWGKGSADREYTTTTGKRANERIEVIGVMSQPSNVAWVPTGDVEVPIIDIQVNSGFALAIRCQKSSIPFVLLKDNNTKYLVGEDRILQEALELELLPPEEAFRKLLG